MIRSYIITNAEENLESEMVMNKLLVKGEIATERNKKTADTVNEILRDALYKLRKLK